MRNREVSLFNFAKTLYLTRFSKPASLRPLWRQVCKRRPRNIVQIGMAQGHLSFPLLKVAARYHAAEEIHFTGIDLFEARPAEAPGLSLKEAHRKLRERGVQVKLLPGDPFSALARKANELTGTDLILISADQDADSLARAWFYVPRMLTPDSLVLVEQPSTDDGDPQYTPLARTEIERLARPTASGRRAA